MPNITFTGTDRTVHVEQGTTLLQAAKDLGLRLDAPCGGKGKCGKCRVTANGQEVLACQCRAEADMTVELPGSADGQILTRGQAAEVNVDPVRPGYLVAVDIGTTTVVCFLLSPEGRELASKSMLNPQVPYGADVMSRMQQALDGELEDLTALIQRGVADLVEKCCAEAGITPDQIGTVCVVGNPCMQQLFLGITPKNLAEIPFAPVLTRTAAQEARSIFPACENAVLLTVPDVGGYVGADTLGCVLAARMDQAEDTVLMVDIGTNGEMVLAHGGRMVACSTAAGPALEGASIRFGMRGAPGAIDRVWLEDGQFRCSVIGGGEAEGICGSGIIDAVAALLDRKLLNKRGRLQSPEEAEGQRIVRLTDQIYLTQEDIRQVQLAKGAIAAGIRLMCAHFGISPERIDRCILAGAFGSFLDPVSACRMGLLPKELSGKITAAGNLAGAGAKMMAMNAGEFRRCDALVEDIELLELAQVPEFQRTFAQCMGFEA